MGSTSSTVSSCPASPGPSCRAGCPTFPGWPYLGGTAPDDHPMTGRAAHSGTRAGARDNEEGGDVTRLQAATGSDLPSVRALGVHGRRRPPAWPETPGSGRCCASRDQPRPRRCSTSHPTPRLPVIGLRSSDTPQAVARHAVAFAGPGHRGGRGMREARPGPRGHRRRLPPGAAGARPLPRGAGEPVSVVVRVGDERRDPRTHDRPPRCSAGVGAGPGLDRPARPRGCGTGASPRRSSPTRSTCVRGLRTSVSSRRRSGRSGGGRPALSLPRGAGGDTHVGGDGLATNDDDGGVRPSLPGDDAPLARLTARWSRRCSGRVSIQRLAESVARVDRLRDWLRQRRDHLAQPPTAPEVILRRSSPCSARRSAGPGGDRQAVTSRCGRGRHRRSATARQSRGRVTLASSGRSPRRSG